jgi:hypothetical protein
MKRSTVLWVAVMVVAGSLVFAIALWRDGGPFSLLEAAGVGAGSGLVIALWIVSKNAVSRAVRRQGQSLRR